MGTAEDLPAAPIEKTVFIEDMTEDQLASAVCDLYTNFFKNDLTFLLDVYI